jgi:hypothetical protein
MKTAFVITSINKPNNIMKLYAKMCKEKAIEYYVIGDQKSPKQFNLKNSNYYSVSQQKNLKLSYAKKCLKNSYVRKNIGYLIAMKNGAEIIVESDDDNYPNKNFFSDLSVKKKCLILRNKGWINIFDYFKKNKKDIIWPRGYPLDEIKKKKSFTGKIDFIESPIQQHLSGQDPDVDAIYRLTHKEKKIQFSKKKPLAIFKRTYSTFNSQNTRWFKWAFPLMYLPTSCTFRSCDIWRGLIALRILHLNNMPLIYSSASNYQVRNYHNLIQDFIDEIPIYLRDKEIINILYSIKLPAGEDKIFDSLVTIYKKLIEKKIFPKKELSFLNCWIKDIKNFI